MSEPIVVDRGGSQLFGERWSGGDRLLVLLHAGVADRRSWREVTPEFEGLATVVTYDRRGHGDSDPSLAPFSHVDDLRAVLDEVEADTAWLVGSSMGGGLALDAALVAPERVEGLVLLARSEWGSRTRVRYRDPALRRAHLSGDRGEGCR